MRLKLIFLSSVILASVASGKTLDQQIANMFVVGFYGTKAPSNSEIMDDICRKGLGGVLLFDRHPSIKHKPKNITSPDQLALLNASLSSCRHKPLIAIDQEGGKVQRLRAKNGFYGKYPKATTVSSRGLGYAQSTYGQMAQEMRQAGINYDLAPIADVAVNRNNVVIYKMGRSYSENANKTAKFDEVFINQMHNNGILTSLKHFPGHGSSLRDTHDGFVDITSTWIPDVELSPYRRLISTGKIDSIMVAHVFNKKIDSRYPASLSRATISGLLRGELGYRGVVISDDLQMGAITKHYNLEQTIRLAINAGTDLLLFGNQLDPKNEVKLSRLIRIVKTLISQGKISKQTIINANKRIDRMKSKIRLAP